VGVNLRSYFLYIIRALFLGLLVFVIISLFLTGEAIVSDIFYIFSYQLAALPVVTISNKKLNPYYVSGFIDGEGCFFCRN
jgi:hypothetical protein